MAARKSQRRSARPRPGTAPGVQSSPHLVFGLRQIQLLLTGASIGLLFAGFGERMYRFIGYTPRAYCVAMPLLAAALCAGIWIASRFSGAGGGSGQRQADPRFNDRRAIAASVASLAASLIIFFLPNWIFVVQRTRDLLLAAFFWSRESVVVLDVIVSAFAVLPAVIVGAILTTTDGEPPRRCALARSATMLAGAGIALALLGAFGAVDLVVRAGIRLAAAPLLVSSVWVVAYRQSPPPLPSRRAARVDPIQEPELRNRWPILLRLAVGISVVCAAGAGAMWAHVASVMRAGSFRVTLVASGLAALGVAIGLRAAAREEDAGRRIGDSGAACVLSGTVLAAAMLLFGAINLAADSPFHRTVGFAVLFLTCLMPATILIGRAIGLTELAVIRRGGGERSAHRFEYPLLICGALGMSVVAWLSLRCLGSFAAIAAIALTLLAAGGVLIIHDPAGDIDGRRRRVAMTFAAILAMTVTLPLIQDGWLRNRQYRRTGLVESWWAAFGMRQDGVAVLYAERGRNEPLHGDDVRGVTAGEHPPDTVVFGAIAAVHSDAGRESFQAIFLPDRPLAWLDQLTRSRDRYDSLTLALSGLPDDLIRRVCSAGALDVAMQRVVPGGRLVVVASAADHPADALRFVAARFARCGASRVRQFALGESGHPAIEFVAEHSDRTLNERWRTVAETRSADVDPRVAAAAP